MKKSILAISGSTRQKSKNLAILQFLGEQYFSDYDFKIYDGLTNLPHFNPDLDTATPPAEVVEWRELIQQATGVIICTPEYVFALPGTLKNALDWTVSTMVFADKTTALITAAMSGQKAHDSLRLVMKTLGASTTEDMQLLIQSAKGKLILRGN